MHFILHLILFVFDFNYYFHFALHSNYLKVKKKRKNVPKLSGSSRPPYYVAVSGGPLNVAIHLVRISFLVLQPFSLVYHFAKPPDWKLLSVIKYARFSGRGRVFLFSADFRLKINIF